MNVTAERAWAAMVASIIAYEVAAPPQQLLSEGIDRLLIRHPIATHAVIGVTALHLLNLLPDRADPLHMISANHHLRKVRRG